MLRDTRPTNGETVANLLFREQAATRIGITWHALDRARVRGLVPEVVKVGRYFLYPADKLDAIRDRLIDAGLIRREPAQA